MRYGAKMSLKNNKILQWNLNGLQARLSHLQYLVSEENPIIVALQELKCDNNYNVYLRGYKVYKLCRGIGGGGGVCLAIHANIPSTPLQIDSDLEAVACTVRFQSTNLNVCCVYFNAQADVSSVSLQNLIDSIPHPRLILGDMNAKHPIWGSPSSDQRGVVLNDFFSEQDLFVLNDGTCTYFNPRTAVRSHLDVSVCDTDISHKFSWSVYPDKFSSDHFPLIISYDIETLYSTKPARWKFDNADWDMYRRVAVLPQEFLDPDIACLELVESLFNSGLEAIPRTSTTTKSKYCCFWWNDDCKDAVVAARRQLRVVYRSASPNAVDEYYRLNAAACQTMLYYKRLNWREFLGTVNMYTSLTKIWRVIRALSGQSRSFSPIVLSIDGQCVSDPNLVAEQFGKFFSMISSNDNYSEDFLLHKIESEFHDIVFPDTGRETYNLAFTKREMDDALDSCTDSSPGIDGITYSMLSNLSVEQRSTLLRFFNYLWSNDLFPEEWRTALVLPFIKPTKPPMALSSYRPISLTSCICKLLEKMVLVRLTAYLEKYNFIKVFQSGFRKLHSTLDPLVRFESAIQETFMKDEYLVAVFLDLEKAYDMVWKHLVLKIMSEMGLKGHLPNFIKNFLSDRKIKIKIGEVITRAFSLENGLPQGSVLSCLLFTMVINSIFDGTDDILKSIFCDDGLFWATGDKLPKVLATIQSALDALSDWCNYHGPKISVTKTHFNIFTKKRNIPNDITLLMNDSPLVRQKTVKYLGVYFDQGLTWKKHIHYVKDCCQKPLALMSNVASRDWGGDRKTLKLMFTSLVRSRIDYASFLYSTAWKGHLGKLDAVQYRAIRIITGNFRNCITDNLEAEANILPLALRRRQLALNYFGKTYRLHDHPVRDLYIDFYRYIQYDIRPYPLPVVGRVKELVSNSGLPFSKLEEFTMSDIYVPNLSVVKYSLRKLGGYDSEMQARVAFNCLIETEYNDFHRVFTDGSKLDGRCGSSVYVDGTIPIFVKKRLPSTSSVFTCELYALYRALLVIRDSPLDYFVIFSDSLSALQYLSNSKKDNRIKINILKVLKSLNKTVIFEWIPAHSGILGNETADKAAKESTLLSSIVKLPLSFIDYKSLVKSFIYEQWQLSWTRFGRCRLRKFKPILGDWKSSYRDVRKEEKMLSRLRTGTVFFNNQHYYDRPLGVDMCVPCNIPMTIKHLLLQCPALRAHRIPMITFIQNNNLPLTEECILGDEFPHDKLFEFLRRSNYASKI